MKKIIALFQRLGRDNPQVFGVMLISALFLCLVRFLAPVEMNWDQAVQLEAAHRLVNGLGLTSTFFPPPFDPVEISSNLNQTPTPQYVTWWPPGFSLLVASLLFLGLPLATTLKLIFGGTTLLGWLGWAILGQHFLAKPLSFGAFRIPVQLPLAALLPIFYTPRWVGTDLFLWAGVPFAVIFLFNSRVSQQFKWVSLVYAGLVFGFLVPIRYSSIFIAIAAFLILFQLNASTLKTLADYIFSLFKTLRKYVIFLASSLVFLIPLALYNNFAGSNKPASSLYANPDVTSTTIPGLPEFVSFTSSFSSLGDAISSILKSSSTIATLSGIPIKPFAAFLNTYPPINLLHGSFCLLLALALPLILLNRTQNSDPGQEKPDLALSLAMMPTALVLLLVASTFAQDYDFVGTPRYYIPVFLATIFLAYEFTTLPVRRLYQWLKLGCSLFIIAFLAYNVLWRPVLLLQQKKGYLAKSIVGSYVYSHPDYRYPSNKIITLYDQASTKLRQLQQEHPDALFFVQDYPFYIYDGHTGLRTIPSIKSEFWQRAYLEKTSKIFWVISRSKCPSVCSSHNTNPIEQLSPPNLELKTVFEAPKERTRIVVSDLPADYKFAQ